MSDATDTHQAVATALANGGSISDEFDAASDVLDAIFADANREALIAAMLHLGVATQPIDPHGGGQRAVVTNDETVGYRASDYGFPMIPLYRLDGHFEA